MNPNKEQLREFNMLKRCLDTLLTYDILNQDEHKFHSRKAEDKYFGK